MIAVRINGVAINAVSEHYPGFWQRAADGEWEPSTYAAIDRHVTPETIFLDIGSHIGAIALYAAHRASRVICVEPDPSSLTMLRDNVAANPLVADRITIIAKAIYPTPQPVSMGSRSAGGDSMSSFVFRHPRTTWLVDAITPGELSAIVGSDRPVFVKMDIERGEYLVVPKAGRLWGHPNLTLLLSLHPQLFTGGFAALASALGSRRIFHALRAYDAARIDEGVWLFTRAAARAKRRRPRLQRVLP